MSGSRIVGDVVDLDPDNIRAFFHQRETRAASDEPLTSVLYQDHDPALARARDAEEKVRLLPVIDAGPGDRVLDVACGIGRWAGPLIGCGAAYVGVDFADGLLEAARRTEPGARFIPRDITRITAEDVAGWAPNRVLIVGGLLYLNDDGVLGLATAIAGGAPGPCRVVLREPTGLGQRLTLDSVESSELGTQYSATYRTRAEFVELFGGPLERAGFILSGDDDLFTGDLNNRAETRQRFYVWERDL